MNFTKLKNFTEVKQRKHIGQKLGFKVVDYNPDGKDFGIFNVINQIYLFMQFKVWDSYHRVILST